MKAKRIDGICLLLWVAATSQIPLAQAETGSCGQKNVTIEAREITFNPVLPGEFTPELVGPVTDNQIYTGMIKCEEDSDLLSPSFYLACFSTYCELDPALGSVVATAQTSQGYAVLTGKNYLQLYPSLDSSETKKKGFNCKAPTKTTRFETLQPSQILSDATLVSSKDSDLLVTNLSGEVRAKIPGAAGKVLHVAERGQGTYRILSDRDGFWVADAQYKVIKKNRFDREREAFASGAQWVAGYSRAASNIIVYGLKGEKIANINLAGKDVARWGVLGTGGPIYTASDQTKSITLYDPRTGAEMHTKRPPVDFIYNESWGDRARTFQIHPPSQRSGSKVLLLNNRIQAVPYDDEFFKDSPQHKDYADIPFKESYSKKDRVEVLRRQMVTLGSRSSHNTVSRLIDIPCQDATAADPAQVGSEEESDAGPRKVIRAQ